MANITIALDLGSVNTRIAINGKVVIDEPSIIVRMRKTEECIAIGKEALALEGRVHPSAEVIRPFIGGMIVNFSAFEAMLRTFLRKAGVRRRLFRHQEMVVSVPSESTEVEKMTICTIAKNCGVKDIRFLPFLGAALGSGLDINNATAHMTVDIGGSHTTAAVICLGGVVESRSVSIGCETLDSDVVEYFKKEHNVKIGRVTAENIRKNLSAVSFKEGGDAPIEIVAMNIDTLLPKTVKVSEWDIAEALNPGISKIAGAVAEVLDVIPPELYSDILEEGILLSGGGALQKGLADLLAEKFGLPFHIAEDPSTTIVRGAAKAAILIK